MTTTVKFHSFPNLTYKRAKEEAYHNNWVIANSKDLQLALDDLNYEPFVVGWISGGILATPLKTSTRTLKAGINLGTIVWEMEPRKFYAEVYPTKGINEGFFYVEGRPRIEADKPAPDTYIVEQIYNGGQMEWSPETWQVESRRRDILKGPFPGQIRAFNYDRFNAMIDGWDPDQPERQLLESAAQSLLQKEGKTYRPRDINLLSLEVKVDPLRRFQFAPFLLKELFKALSATTPNPAQASYQKRFNNFTSCKKWLYANKLLEDWKIHTNAPDAKIQKMPDGSYKPPTLSVWKEVMHNRPSKRGFLAMDIAVMYFTPKGVKVLSQLLAPAYLSEYPKIEDKINLKSIGGDIKDELKAGFGVSAFAIFMFLSWYFLKRHIVVTARLQAALEIEAAAFNGENEIIAMERDMLARIKEINANTGVTITKDGIETAEVAGSGLSEVSEEVSVELVEHVAALVEATAVEDIEPASAFLDSLADLFIKSMKFSDKIIESLFTKFPLLKSASDAVQKFFAATAFKSLSTFLSVFGIAATSAQVLGEELSDIVSAANYDEELRKASDWELDNVSEYLNPSSTITDYEKDGRKVNVLHDLLNYTITLPGERGLISFQYPELADEFGKKKGIFGNQYWDVKFFRVYDQTLDHAKKMAESRNMRLATLDEVFQAFVYLKMTGGRGLIDSGEFIFPIREGYLVNQGISINQGLNKGIQGDNDGFYYIDVEPELGVVKQPLSPLPSNRKPDFELNKIKNSYLNRFLLKGRETNVLLGPADQWKIIYKDEYIKKGKVRIQHVKSGLYLMSEYNNITSKQDIILGHPIQDYTFMLMGNYGMWTIEEKPGKPYVYLKDEVGQYLNSENGVLQVSKIQPNWYSPAWEIVY